MSLSHPVCHLFFSHPPPLCDLPITLCHLSTVIILFSLPVCHLPFVTILYRLPICHFPIVISSLSPFLCCHPIVICLSPSLYCHPNVMPTLSPLLCCLPLSLVSQLLYPRCHLLFVVSIGYCLGHLPFVTPPTLCPPPFLLFLSLHFHQPSVWQTCRGMCHIVYNSSSSRPYRCAVQRVLVEE